MAASVIVVDTAGHDIVFRRAAVGGAPAAEGALLVQHAECGSTDLVQGHAQRFQRAGSDAFAFAHQSEQEMLGTDVVMAEIARLSHRQLDDPFRARCHTALTARSLAASSNREFNGAPNLVQLDAEVRKHLGGYPLALADEAQEQMLRTDIVMVETLRFLLGEGENGPGTLREPVKTLR